MTTRKNEILDVAEMLFRQEGYKSVNLRTLGQKSDMKKASLYYHFPGGKEEIFVKVNLRSFKRHGMKLNEIQSDSTLNFTEKINNVVEWMVSQPGLHLISMMQLDMENLSKENYDRLFNSLFNNIFMPISFIFKDGISQNEIEISSPQIASGAFLALLDSFEIIPNATYEFKKQSLLEVVNIFINGMRRKN